MFGVVKLDEHGDPKPPKLVKATRGAGPEGEVDRPKGLLARKPRAGGSP